MLPGPPLPDRLSARRHLGEVVRVHLASFSRRPGRILARGEAVLLHPSFDAAGDVVGHPAHASQQHVSIAQQDAVVMVVWMAYFPEHLAVPVHFHDHATLERKAAEKALLWSTPGVEECSAAGAVAGHAWRGGHVHGVVC